MAHVPGRRAGRLALALAAAVAWTAPVRADAADGAALDLIGTWHVLIHYTDDHSHDPEQLRWDDRVWVFERSGSRLRWIEYPIVVFKDQTGRFERRRGGSMSRVLHGWEPNAAQRAAIAAGLEVNPRGQKSKTLRPSGDGGWRSAGRASPASASIVTYVEHWSIESAASLPVFRRVEVMGAGRTDDLEGVTEYATTEVSRAGAVLHGRFERDGSRRGTFRIRRSGPTAAVSSKTASVGQRFYARYLGGLQAALAKREPDIARAAAVVRSGGPAELSRELRERARVEVRAAIEESILEVGADPGDFEPEVVSLSRQIESGMIDDGLSAADVVRLLQEGRINP
jgi:hypothetical protein